MKRFVILSGLMLLAGGFLTTCANSKNSGGFNIFPLSEDITLGAQVATEIEANPAQYPILDSASNKEIYAYIYKIRNNILNSGQVEHKNDFAWRVRIIRDDSTLNAFCTPGGYIYVYTGILKYLDNEAQLAGVMGHEIAHADLRHSTRQMTKQFGVDVLLAIVAGNREMLRQVAGAVVGLKFSREHETEADGNSVKYLCPTPYQADGGAGFFQKMQDAGSGSNPPEFLSTHPNPAGRIEHFHNTKAELGCAGTQDYNTEYKRMVAKLP
jgi:beta-barrel assembly-enhancing protease